MRAAHSFIICFLPRETARVCVCVCLSAVLANYPVPGIHFTGPFQQDHANWAAHVFVVYL